MTQERRKLGRASAAGIAAACALLALPAAGHAARITIGSSLAAAPDTALSDHSDSGFWQSRDTTVPGGGAPTLPEGGQILEVRVKGVALVAPNGTTPEQPSPGYTGPNNVIHFQTLTPQADGNLRVAVTSGTFYMPFNVPESTVTTFQPENMCANAGDSIDITTIGGWDGTSPGSGGYDAGVPFKIFATVPGASLTRFHGHGHFNNGAVLVDGTMTPPDRPMPTPEEQRGTELLMQVVVGTGPDAVILCPGGTYNPWRTPDQPKPTKPSSSQGTGGMGPAAKPASQLATIEGTRLALSRSRTGSLPLACPPGPSACTGSVSLRYSYSIRKRGRRKVHKSATLGTAAFTVPAGQSGAAAFSVKARALAALSRRRSGRTIKVSAVAVTDPGGTGLTDSRTVKLGLPVKRHK